MISWLKRQLCRVRLPCKHFLYRRPVASFVLLVLLLLLLQVFAMNSWDTTPSHIRRAGASLSAPPAPQVGGLQAARRGVGRILGAAPHDRAKYIADSQGLFWCFGSQLALPFSQVNDDYCDCPDGSDEPSTSACPGGKFYCSSSSMSLPSSRVNDGVCDCCDGSDEFAGVHLLQRPDRERQEAIGRYLPPCPNTCH